MYDSLATDHQHAAVVGQFAGFDKPRPVFVFPVRRQWDGATFGTAMPGHRHGRLLPRAGKSQRTSEELGKVHLLVAQS